MCCQASSVGGHHEQRQVAIKVLSAHHGQRTDERPRLGDGPCGIDVDTADHGPMLHKPIRWECASHRHRRIGGIGQGIDIVAEAVDVARDMQLQAGGVDVDAGIHGHIPFGQQRRVTHFVQGHTVMHIVGIEFVHLGRTPSGANVQRQSELLCGIPRQSNASGNVAEGTFLALDVSATATCNVRYQPAHVVAHAGAQRKVGKRDRVQRVGTQAMGHIVGH